MCDSFSGQFRPLKLVFALFDGGNVRKEYYTYYCVHVPRKRKCRRRYRYFVAILRLWCFCITASSLTIILVLVKYQLSLHHITHHVTYHITDVHCFTCDSKVVHHRRVVQGYEGKH